MESGVEVCLCVDMLVFLLGGECGGSRLSVLVVLCLAWGAVPAQLLACDWRSYLLSGVKIVRGGKNEQHWLPRWAFWLKKKSQSMLEGSRRGELVSKQIPKADGAWRLYWSEMPSALTQKLWVIQRAIDCELGAAGWQGWPCLWKSLYSSVHHWLLKLNFDKIHYADLWPDSASYSFLTAA